MNCSRIMFFAFALICSVMAFSNENVVAEVCNVIVNQQDECFTAGKIKVEDVVINDKKKVVEIKCNSALADRPFTAESISKLVSAVKNVLPEKSANYKIQITANGIDVNALALYAKKKVVAPKEKTPFIVAVDGISAPSGLEGANIAMWQSHGWYFEPDLNRWEWQRARIFQTVEDLYTQSYVMPFLMPMLQNAGAYVLSPRDRDINTCEVIVDADGGYAQQSYIEKIGKELWGDANTAGFAYKKAILSYCLCSKEAFATCFSNCFVSFFCLLRCSINAKISLAVFKFLSCQSVIILLK